MAKFAAVVLSGNNFMHQYLGHTLFQFITSKVRCVQFTVTPVCTATLHRPAMVANNVVSETDQSGSMMFNLLTVLACEDVKADLHAL
jgi:hypothetical protein